ncbi:putative ribonuclease H-like domain-containing protein, partial [Tanacetum coccineum]
MMGIPNEHQLKFNSIKDAKLLLEAIEKRFGGNAATKKTQRNLLKQQYENFTAPSSETLNQTFDRLQKLVSHLEILGETLSQEDVNQKLLRRLSQEWNTHVVVWRNKPELETMSMDDLYNNLKVYEPKVKGTSHSSTSTQNMAFVSSNNSGSTNAFFSSQPSSPQLGNEDLQQLYPDGLEEMDLRWQMAMLTMRARRFLKKPGRKVTINGNETIGFDKESSKRSVLVETTTPKSLISCDGLGGYDWSDHAEEGPTNYARMAYSSSSSEDIQVGEITIRELRKKLEIVQKEKDGIQFNVDKFENASKSLNKIIESQIVNNCKKSLGYNVVPPPLIGNFMPPKPDLSFTGLEEFNEPVVIKHVVENNEAKASEAKPKAVRKNNGAPIIKDWVSDSEEENVSQTKTEKKTAKQWWLKGETEAEAETNTEAKDVNVISAQTSTNGGDAVAIDVVSTKTKTKGEDHDNKAAGTDTTKTKKNLLETTTNEDWTGANSILKEDNNLVREAIWCTVAIEIMGELCLEDHDNKAAGTDTTKTKKNLLETTMNGDWTGADSILKEDNNLVREAISSDDSTILHIAVGIGNNEFVKNLFSYISAEDVVATRKDGSTALHIAAIACQKGKQHKASCKSKTENSISLPLHLLHMDLFGPTFVKGLIKKMYCLVVTNDYSRFTWVFFLASKDETSDILNESIDQKKDDNVNSTNNVNAASTNKVNVVGEKTSIELPDDPNMPALEDISIFDLSRDNEDVGAEADMNNLDTTIQVSPIPTTRIHKDHPFNQVIGDLQSATQTRNMSKNLEEHGFVSTIQQRTNHKDLQNCLFAYFLITRRTQKGNSCIEISKLDRGYARRASTIQVTRSLDFGG